MSNVPLPVVSSVTSAGDVVERIHRDGRIPVAADVRCCRRLVVNEFTLMAVAERVAGDIDVTTVPDGHHVDGRCGGVAADVYIAAVWPVMLLTVADMLPLMSMLPPVVVSEFMLIVVTFGLFEMVNLPRAH